jgi:hypothetical protein
MSGATAARAGDARFTLLTPGSVSACWTISQVAAEKARNIAIGMYTHQLIIASSTQRRADQALAICLALSLAGWVLTALWPGSEPALNVCGPPAAGQSQDCLAGALL